LILDCKIIQNTYFEDLKPRLNNQQ